MFVAENFHKLKLYTWVIGMAGACSLHNDQVS